MLQKEKTQSLKTIYLLKKPIIPTDWITENDLCQILWMWFLNFYQRFELFFMACLTQTQ